MKETDTREGHPAPDFSLRDANGREWRLGNQRGKVVVLLFYPGDETPICTRQMCSVRDRWSDYEATGAEVVGISTLGLLKLPREGATRADIQKQFPQTSRRSRGIARFYTSFFG